MSGESRLSSELRGQFERVGAKLEIDENFREMYNLDFIVSRLDAVHAHVNLGIHITSKEDDLEDMKAFAQASRRGVVLKSLYIEISEVSIDAGGVLVAFSAALAFLFDRRHHNHRVLGMKVYEDCTYQFFDLEESVQRLERISDDDDLVIGEELDGRIIAYFTDKGFGFIQTDDERKYFFHIANVVDDDLRSRLPGYVLGELIPVNFQYGGNDGKKYPKAINVSLDEDLGEDSYFDEDDYDAGGY